MKVGSFVSLGLKAAADSFRMGPVALIAAAPVEAPPAPAGAPPSAAGTAVAEPEVIQPASRPATPPPVATAAAKGQTPALPEPIDPNEYRRVKALLYHLLEMLGGSQPFDVAVISEAEQTARRLQQEVASQFGGAVYTVAELEKQGVVLRQKYDLAQSLLHAVQRGRLALAFSTRRRELLLTGGGGMLTGLVSTLCAVLAVQAVRTDTLLINPTPHPLELLRAALNPESLIPFLGFQMIALLFGLFTLYAIARCWRLSRGFHALRRSLRASHIDPRTIARLT